MYMHVHDREREPQQLQHQHGECAHTTHTQGKDGRPLAAPLRRHINQRVPTQSVGAVARPLQVEAACRRSTPQ